MSFTFDPTQYKVLSFDIYATLIDWETGIYNAFRSLIEEIPANSPYHRSKFPSDTKYHKLVLGMYRQHEGAFQEEFPTLSYPEILSRVYLEMSKNMIDGVGQHDTDTPTNKERRQTEARDFAASIGSWPAFPDTIVAMRELGKHYKLIALSNVDRDSFARTCAGPLDCDKYETSSFRFDAKYVAQDIGSYKPDLRNFDYLVRESHQQFGNSKAEILHVAQSLEHDHIPALQAGFEPGVYISRGGKDSGIGGNIEELEQSGKLKLAATFKTLGEFAEFVREAFEKQK